MHAHTHTHALNLAFCSRFCLSSCKIKSRMESLGSRLPYYPSLTQTIIPSIHYNSDYFCYSYGCSKFWLLSNRSTNKYAYLCQCLCSSLRQSCEGKEGEEFPVMYRRSTLNHKATPNETIVSRPPPAPSGIYRPI